MTDTKQKCQGCGAETMSDVGWCLACRSILYTNLQIAQSDFRQSEFKTMVFPVRDVIWLQERVRLRDAEIKAMDIVNDEMGVTIASLRADLAEAHADVQRFEAALDVSQRELAEARAADVEADILDAIEAVCELADAEYVRYREQWAGIRDSVIDDSARDIGKVRQWLTERDIVRKGGKARDSRRTIRALVVFGRAAWRSLRTLAGNQARWQMAQLGVKVNMLLISERSKTTHD